MANGTVATGLQAPSSWGEGETKCGKISFIECKQG